jgi:uncharacterized protein involved in response to NO
MKSSVFNYGFRPLFLAAGVAAVVLIPLWAVSFAFGTALGTQWPPTLWHGHEMLFGFVAAAVAGFLLTAVPSWTGQGGFAGRPLMALLTLWCLGRMAVFLSASLPSWLVAAVDVSFFPALGVLIAPPLLREINRNTPLLGVLAALTLCNGLFHWAVSRGNAPLAEHVLLITIEVLLVLATVIGGRIVPAFTASTLKQRGLTLAPSVAIVERGTIGLMIAIVAFDILWPGTRVAGALAMAASAAQLIRMLRWRPFAIWREPIVWVLHLGYAWIPVGLALKGIAILSRAAFAAFWLHALTAGALTTLILAVMTRAALGHTGRPLKVAAPITAAYVLLTAAALVRVFGFVLLRVAYPAVVLSAGLLWTAAFALFVIVYTPILTGPRADGKAG